MSYKKNGKYFDYISLKPGIITVFIGFLFIGANVFLGLIIMGVGGLLIYLQISGRATDTELDAFAISKLDDMKKRALKKLGVDEEEVNEIEPIAFDGYVYDNDARIKKGKDGLYRSNKYQSVMFFFSSNEVHCYTYDFFLDRDNQRESTDVYFYKDLVSVSTQTEGTEYSVGKGKSSKFDYEYFKLTTTGGNYISCSVKNINDAQRSINGMRTLIKSKKMA